MKNLKNLAAFVATAALATAAMAQNIDNWRNASGDVWKNASGDCWRDANWTPATAAAGCDGAIVAPKAAPAPVAAPWCFARCQRSLSCCRSRSQQVLCADREDSPNVVGRVRSLCHHSVSPASPHRCSEPTARWRSASCSSSSVSSSIWSARTGSTSCCHPWSRVPSWR